MKHLNHHMSGGCLASWVLMGIYSSSWPWLVDHLDANINCTWLCSLTFFPWIALLLQKRTYHKSLQVEIIPLLTRRQGSKENNRRRDKKNQKEMGKMVHEKTRGRGQGVVSSEKRKDSWCWACSDWGYLTSHQGKHPAWNSLTLSIISVLKPCFSGCIMISGAAFFFFLWMTDQI